MCQLGKKTCLINDIHPLDDDRMTKSDELPTPSFFASKRLIISSPIHVSGFLLAFCSFPYTRLITLEYQRKYSYAFYTHFSFFFSWKQTCITSIRGYPRTGYVLGGFFHTLCISGYRHIRVYVYMQGSKFR